MKVWSMLLFLGLFFHGVSLGTSCLPRCGRVIERNVSRKEIIGFKNPEKKGEKDNCTWIITVQSGLRVQLSFTAFHLETSKCNYDSVRIYEVLAENSFRHKRTFCGNNIPPNQYARKGIKVDFNSDASQQLQFFMAIIYAVPEGCDGSPKDFRGSSGELKSPFYPRYYGIKHQCVWRITVPKGYRVRLNFTFFELEARGCNFDFVEIRNGLSNTSSLLGKYCGSRTPPIHYADSGTMRVKFVSDIYKNHNGFRAVFAAVNYPGCAGTPKTIQSSSGVLTSPGHPQNYGNNVQCVWKITVPHGLSVQLSFTSFALESGCNYDFLEVRNGLSDSSPLLGKYCGSRAPSIQYADSGTMQLKFVSDGSATFSGFRATFRAIRVTGCGGTPQNINGSSGVITSLTYPRNYGNNQLCVWISCGGTTQNIQSSSGAITSPAYPRNYASNQRCVWKIVAPNGLRVQLVFTSFDLESENTCNNDWVEVRNGLNNNSPLLGKYCGSTTPPNRYASSGTMQVTFVSNRYINKRGFRASFIAVPVPGCDGTRRHIHSSSGVISSPTHPRNYGNNQRCVWQITVPNGLRVQLLFTSFYLQSSRSCSYDWIEIRDGLANNSNLLGKYCGNNRPPRLSASNGNMTVKFISNGYANRRGFRAIFRTVPYPGCDATPKYIRSSSGFLVSPNFPKNYGNNQRCVWRVIVPKGFRVQIIFTSFDLESKSSCTHDFVEVRDGLSDSSPLIGKYCGNKAPSTLYASSGTVQVKFVSNGSPDKTGFRAAFQAVPFPGCDGTPQNLQSSSGVIASPHYPRNYKGTERCTWRITVPKGFRVQLSFTSFDLESKGSCKYDSVEVRNGLGDDFPLLGKYCGSHIPPKQYAGNGTMQVKFSSDDSTNRGGFRAMFRAVPILGCDGKPHFILRANGFITSPNYPRNYGKNQRCVWRITVPKGFGVRLTFNTFELGLQSNCQKHSVEIRNGLSDNSPLLGRFCGGSSPVARYADSGTVQVKFVSKGSDNKRGFQATFTAVPIQGCNGKPQQIQGSSGTITSPNYPRDYGVNKLCIWKITAPNGLGVRLSFTVFDLESQSSCKYDSVEIRNGLGNDSLLLGKYCGTSTPPIRRADSGKMQLKFKSDGSNHRKGFRATFSAVDLPGCDGKPQYVRSSSGFISSPNHPRNHGHGQRCVWRIRVPNGLRVQLTFDNIDLESHSNCNYDFVEIRNGLSDNSPLMGKYCGSRTPPTRYASSGSMQIKFVSDGSTSKKGFLARFRAVAYPVKGSCGVLGKTTGASVNISSCSRGCRHLIVGRNAQVGSWPWQAVLLHRNSFKCGGSLIDRNWVLTAAQCVDKDRNSINYRVVMGDHNRVKTEGSEQNLDVKRIIIHPRWNSKTLNNDVALLELSRPVVISNRVATVCLPRANVDIRVGSQCYTTGWGVYKMKHRGGRVSILQEAMLPVVSTRVCQRQLKHSPLGHKLSITRQMECAGDVTNNKLTCYGDGGGPFVCRKSGRWVLEGVFSWGTQICSNKQRYTVYARISEFRNWINSYIALPK